MRFKHVFSYTNCSMSVVYPIHRSPIPFIVVGLVLLVTIFHLPHLLWGLLFIAISTSKINQTERVLFRSWKSKVVCQNQYILKWRCDHRSCNRNPRNSELSPKNRFPGLTGFEPVASAFALQCSTNWAVVARFNVLVEMLTELNRT